MSNVVRCVQLQFIVVVPYDTLVFNVEIQKESYYGKVTRIPSICVASVDMTHIELIGGLINAEVERSIPVLVTCLSTSFFQFKRPNPYHRELLGP